MRGSLAILGVIGAGATGCTDVGLYVPGLFDSGPPGTDAVPGTDAAPPATDAAEPCIGECPVDETMTGPVDFRADIEALFTGFCSYAFCHTGMIMGGTEILTEGNICTSTVNVPARETMFTSHMSRITPGDPEASYLFHKVRGTHECPPALGGGRRMPYTDPCLTPEQLGTLRAWILDGAACD